MKNQMGGSRMDTILKMLLIAFISLLAFSSGVYFGKQMSDTDYQLKALESDFTSQTGKHASSRKKLDASEEEAIMDAEVAALSEKFVENERDMMDDFEATEAMPASEERGLASAQAKTGSNENENDENESNGGDPAETRVEEPNVVDHEAANAATNAASRFTRPDLNEAHKAALRIANNTAPTEAEKAAPESRLPTSLPKTVGGSTDVEFTVQVASYPDPEMAKSHANELVKKGLPAFPVKAVIDGKTWYRVSVGSFKTKKAATSELKKLMKEAKVSSAIVQKIQR